MKQMFRISILMAAMLLIFAGVKAQGPHILYTPYYDNLNVHAAGTTTMPLVWNASTHAMERADTSSQTSFVNTYIKGLGYTGYYGVNKNTGKNVFFGGIGRYNAGEIVLFDSTGIMYFKIKDTLGTWNVNSYMPYSFNIRYKEAFNIDTFKGVHFDTAVYVTGLLQGTSGTDSLVGYNASNHQLEKLAPMSALNITSLSKNGDGATTAFTVTVAAGFTKCVATSQNSAGTVQSCAISGTTITVTFASAPLVGTGNVKATIIYQ